MSTIDPGLIAVFALLFIVVFLFALPPFVWLAIKIGKPVAKVLEQWTEYWWGRPIP